MLLKYAITLSLMLCLPFTVATRQDDSHHVKHAGALKNFKMKGDISAKFNLKDLEHLENLYALGALEKLKGEVQIFDSQPHHTLVADGQAAFDKSYDQKASLLVYAQVKSWREVPIPEHISSQASFEAYVAEVATQHGISAQQPFPFLVKGEAKSLSWHIIDWDENDKEHSHQKHIESGLNGTLKNIEIQVLGFFSTQHKAIFTHHTSNMHMHFLTADKSLAGHVDDLIPSEQMRLYFPAVD